MKLTNYLLGFFTKKSATTYKHDEHPENDQAKRATNDKRTVKTFTFYIPAPPPRKHGYREKEFDKLFYTFINSGYKIISIQTATHSGPLSSGLWIICVVESTNITNDQLDLSFPSLSYDLNNNEDIELDIRTETVLETIFEEKENTEKYTKREI
ncbi:MAG: hypothetical protein HQK49_00865 [Oligoflexia bacterium]|nr:hypothetical protein [Oligoflexia bacterium]